MLVCQSCHSTSLVPLKLECDHVYCFLCLFYNYNGNTCCQTNDPFEVSNLANTDNDRYYIWLYSSNYGNTWWCYKKEICEQIESIYQDYNLRKKILINEEENNIINLSVLKKSTKSKSESLVNYKDKFEELDTSNESAVEFNDETPISSPKLKPQANIISYIIKINGNEYKLDFDLMKQINLDDTTKKRAITRIEIPNEIRTFSGNALIKYLANTYNIIGVSGRKF
ncbi:hypothetical protein Indivirus_2_65 [Indivirus ILV1]|uniref:WWE domain-containing protein n=1 Tax=Indivirus ILV1 TaxID=1977633 RepID=A0A1V0SD97_9VIRU|nr:hypothetical protein Indivirus_2_65 [Indivirus ILV1]